MKLAIKVSECDCKKCSIMCHAPCCGTPEDMQLLIEAGYGKRLMHDDWPDSTCSEEMLKPALKGHEGDKAPWDVATEAGCTFWRNGKCDLHSKGLKPCQGKLAHHSLTKDQNEEIGEYIKEAWKGEKGKEVIRKWKELNE